MSLNSKIHGIMVGFWNEVSSTDLAWVFVVYISKAFKWIRLENWQSETSDQNLICY